MVQASSGMYAFGDFLLCVGVFGLMALFPTGLALWFLRPFHRLWNALAVAALAVAVTGPVALIVNTLKSFLPLDQPFWMIVLPFGLLRMFGAPLLAAAFMIPALIAPTRFSSRLFLGATAIEGMIGMFAFYHWLGSTRLL